MGFGKKYAILMPLFLINNFDPLVPMATIFLGSAVGCMFSKVTPFSTIIASNAAGISFNEGLKFRFVALIVFSIISLLYIYRYIKRVKENSNNSLVIEEQEEIKEKFLKDYSQENDVKFNWRKKIILFLFLFQFVIMIRGVSSLGWWFQEVAAMFFGVAIIIMLISGLSEDLVKKKELMDLSLVPQKL